MEMNVNLKIGHAAKMKQPGRIKSYPGGNYCIDLRPEMFY